MLKMDVLCLFVDTTGTLAIWDSSGAIPPRIWTFMAGVIIQIHWMSWKLLVYCQKSPTMISTAWPILLLPKFAICNENFDISSPYWSACCISSSQVIDVYLALHGNPFSKKDFWEQHRTLRSDRVATDLTEIVCYDSARIYSFHKELQFCYKLLKLLRFAKGLGSWETDQGDDNSLKAKFVFQRVVTLARSLQNWRKNKAGTKIDQIQRAPSSWAFAQTTRAVWNKKEKRIRTKTKMTRELYKSMCHKSPIIKYAGTLQHFLAWIEKKFLKFARLFSFEKSQGQSN